MIGSITDFINFFQHRNRDTAETESVIEKQTGASLQELEGTGAFTENYSTYWKRCSIQKLEQMRRDETVSAAEDFLTFYVMQKIGIDNYCHDNEAIQTLVRKSIEKMDGSFKSHIRELLGSSIFYGFAVAQAVYRANKSNYLWGWMVNYPSNELDLMVTKNELGKEFISSVVLRMGNYSAKNFIIARHGDLTNLYGFGRGNFLEKFFDIKLLAIKMWGIFLQKFTMPTIVGKTDIGPDKLFKKLIKWLYSNVFVIDKQEDIQLIENQKQQANNEYLTATNFANKMIYRIFFLPALLESGEKGGSYALGDIHFDMFDLSAEWIASEFKDTVLLAQMVQNLIEYNFGPQEDYGDFRPDPKKKLEEKEKLSVIFDRLVNDGVLDPISDNEWMRKDLEFPESKLEQIQEEILREVTPDAEVTPVQQKEYIKN